MGLLFLASREKPGELLREGSTVIPGFSMTQQPAGLGEGEGEEGRVWETGKVSPT